MGQAGLKGGGAWEGPSKRMVFLWVVFILLLSPATQMAEEAKIKKTREQLWK